MTSGSTYKIIELVGTSTTSWEEAAKSAIETASKSLKEDAVKCCRIVLYRSF